METTIVVVVSIFTVGIVIGTVIRSRWALLYPLVLTVGWGLWGVANDAGTGEEGPIFSLLVLVTLGFLPALFGTLFGFGFGKAIGNRK